MRYDIISDTHGYLSKRLLDQLQGADTIVHAGDICSASDYRTLSQIAPVQLCLGNNDWSYDFGPEVSPFVEKDRATGVLMMNPGSPTYPRSGGPSMGRIICEEGKVVSARIIPLDVGE